MGLDGGRHALACQVRALREDAEQGADGRLEAGKQAAHAQHQVEHDERRRLIEPQRRHLGPAHGGVREEPQHREQSERVQDPEAAPPRERAHGSGSLDGPSCKRLDGEEHHGAEHGLRPKEEDPQAVFSGRGDWRRSMH